MANNLLNSVTRYVQNVKLYFRNRVSDIHTFISTYMYMYTFMSCIVQENAVRYVNSPTQRKTFKKNA